MEGTIRKFKGVEWTSAVQDRHGWRSMGQTFVLLLMMMMVLSPSPFSRSTVLSSPSILSLHPFQHLFYFVFSDCGNLSYEVVFAMLGLWAMLLSYKAA